MLKYDACDYCDKKFTQSDDSYIHSSDASQFFPGRKFPGNLLQVIPGKSFPIPGNSRETEIEQNAANWQLISSFFGQFPTILASNSNT